MLLPPCESGHTEPYAELEDIIASLLKMEPDRKRPDRVYLTSRRELGRAYAYLWGHKHGGLGALYVAAPVGPADPDPDLPEHSVQCAAARVLRVYDPAVTISRHKALRQLRKVISCITPESDPALRALLAALDAS
jgi:hypothetical protein